MKHPFLHLLIPLTLVACAPDLLGTPAPTTVPTQTARAANPTAPPHVTPVVVPAPSATVALPTSEPPTHISDTIVDPAAYHFVRVAQGFHRLLYLTHAGDGSGRLFIVEQAGRIFSQRPEEANPQLFLDVSNLITTRSNEQGLLGLAFHPRYAENGYLYVHYSDTRGDTVLARYQVLATDPTQADPASAVILLQADQPYPNHNGGQLAFGPDGYLYFGLGDGGSGGDPDGNGQKLNTVLGKILRLDVDNDNGYVIPADNPLVNTPKARPEIWASGLRNPWRFSFDRATGDLFIADVGQNKYEEINWQPAHSPGGENYGWNFREGLHAFEGAAPPGLTDPILEYTHSVGGCSVTGGYVYRGAALPALQGAYFYGDYCSGRIWFATLTDDGWQSAVFADTDFSISSFGEDEAGELYVLDHSGSVYRLERKP